LAGNNFDNPPASDEIEVSVFGPGYGEAILIHCGENNWVQIDSCIDVESKEPSTIQYFRHIGVDPAKSLQLVIASHWHDDHIRGLSAVLEMAPSALFACSAGLHTDNFLVLAQSHKRTNYLSASGINEFAKILEIIKQRALLGNRSSLRWAGFNKILWCSTLETLNNKPKAQIISLSPHDDNITKSFQALASLLPQEYTTQRKIIDQNPNHLAVAIWVCIGDISLLLGSDLEEGDNVKGWSMIVNDPYRPSGKAELFKIPHHGSHTAHSSDVWTELLIPDVWAPLTPYSRGGGLPTGIDKNRIKSQTTNAFITTSIHPRKHVYPKAVEKTLNGIIRGEIKEMCPKYGSVTFRKKICGGTWTYFLRGSACQL
jgi:hypothetical protein